MQKTRVPINFANRAIAAAKDAVTIALTKSLPMILMGAFSLLRSSFQSELAKVIMLRPSEPVLIVDKETVSKDIYYI